LIEAIGVYQGVWNRPVGRKSFPGGVDVD